MFLNHASVLALGPDRESITRWLKDLTSGMAVLVRDRVIQDGSRTAHALHEIPCLPE